jgi:hypothetical protein
VQTLCRSEAIPFHRRRRSDSFEKKSKIGRSDLNLFGVTASPRQRKRSAMQSLVKNPESGRLMPKDLHAIATAVQEQEEMTGGDVAAKNLPNHGGQTVEGSTKIRPLSVREDSDAIRKI